jgi:hypothetical protein
VWGRERGRLVNPYAQRHPLVLPDDGVAVAECDHAHDIPAPDCSCGICFVPDERVFWRYANAVPVIPVFGPPSLLIFATFGIADKIGADPDHEGRSLGSLRTNTYDVWEIFAQDDDAAEAVARTYPDLRVSSRWPWPVIR